MARRNYNQDDMKGVIGGIQKLNKWKNRFITGLVFAACGAVIIFLIVLMLGTRTEEIIEKHENLSGAPHDSKQQFAMRNVIITYDDNGKMSIQIVQGNNGNNAGVGGVGDSDPGTPDSDGDVGGGSDGGDDSGNTGGDDKGPEPPKPVNATDENVIKFFVDKGYARNAAIGIAANLKAESGYDITADNGVGNKGIAQWDSGRWGCYQTYLSQIGQSDSLGAQLEFVYMEMNNIAPATNQYSNKLSVSNFNNSCSGKYYATKIVAKYYERCGVESNGYKVDWDGTNSSNDSKFINTCQGGQTRINYASAMN